MRTTAAVTLSAVMLVATVAAVPLVGVAQTSTETATATPTGTTGENTTAPGEQFAGVVGVQAAEVNGEIETRRFETRLDRASNATERARVVAETTNGTEERLAELRERRERIEAAHENGSLSDGQYRAQLARLAAEIRTTERMANRSAEVTESLPEGAVEAGGLNRSAVEEVRRNARELGGQKVSEAARDIAGRGDDPPRGPPDERSSNEDGDPGNAADASRQSNESRPGNASANGSATSGGANAAERGESGDNGPSENRPNDDDESSDRKAPTENRRNGDGSDSDDARGNGTSGGEGGADDSTDEGSRQGGNDNRENGGNSGDNRNDGNNRGDDGN